MGFKEAVRSVLSQYATFSGRARRSEFWFFQLFCIIAIITAGIVGAVIGAIVGGTESAMTFGVILYYLCALALILPTLAVTVRRLHDIGRSGWWILIGLVPFIGAIIMLIFNITDSKPDNQYGPNPKGFNE
ncbi:MAG: DUF805 domain-containing protein [Prevotella sp.]|nr:DUF805 domain-containing protein [Prevotella sp.]